MLASPAHPVPCTRCADSFVKGEESERMGCSECGAQQIMLLPLFVIMIIIALAALFKFSTHKADFFSKRLPRRVLHT